MGFSGLFVAKHLTEKQKNVFIYPAKTKQNRRIAMKVLLAEDVPAEMKRSCELLESWGYKVVTAADGKSAWEKAQELESEKESFIAILDINMPKMDGLEVCRLIKELPTFIYVMILTGTPIDKVFRDALQAGADDYMLKPWEIHQAKWDMVKGEQRIEQRARDTSDELTGFLNRREGIKRLNIELARSYREKTCVALMFMDLDNFKDINDTYGHLAGDLVIKETAQRIKSSVRGYDIRIRYGGDEFLLAFPNARNQASMEKTGRKLIEKISGDPVVLPQSFYRISVGVSIGVALSSMEEANFLGTLIAQADKAMYESKHKGKNQMTIFHL